VSSLLKLLFAILLVVTIGGRAVSLETAPPPQRRSTSRSLSFSIPRTVSFREVAGRGLLVRTWVNGVGPFNFAVDTGAGATLISTRIATEAHVARTNDRPTSIAGLTGARTTAYRANIESLSIGDAENYLPAQGQVIITAGLPPDLDGVLDPTEAFSPLGYTIDLPRSEVAAFDPQIDPVQKNRMPAEGTVVTWLRDADSRRPFVMLDNGDRALLDTGSSLGFAVRDTNPGKSSAYSMRDVGGGRLSTRRVMTTIAIGSLTLTRVPTDLVSGSDLDAPVLLGLAALRPFRLRFDPVHRLIEIAPALNR
jgi:hypothetical protein